MDMHIIFGVHITERVKHAGEVQKTLTAHGNIISTRLGLHDADGTRCSPNGLVLLELLDDEKAVNALKSALQSIEGVEVQTMQFDHP